MKPNEVDRILATAESNSHKHVAGGGMRSPISR